MTRHLKFQRDLRFRELDRQIASESRPREPEPCGPKPRTPHPTYLPGPTEPWESRRARYLRETGRSERQ